MRRDQARRGIESPSGKTTVLTIETVDQIAATLKDAYYLRHRDKGTAHIEGRVWSLAARRLLSLHRTHPELPVDPVLFVACLPEPLAGREPWHGLIQRRSLVLYRNRLRSITRRLQRELTREVALAEAEIERGQPIEMLLTWPSRRVSPLGRYIVAQRADRPDLARAFRQDAYRQHMACPLYRPASRSLLGSLAYPIADLLEMIAPAKAAASTYCSPSRN